jgi:hypothetical protein
MTTAQDCFTAAESLRARGHYLDAQVLYDRACTLAPENIIYAEARDRLHLQALAFFKKRDGSEKEERHWHDGCLRYGCECGCELCDCCSECYFIC